MATSSHLPTICHLSHRAYSARLFSATFGVALYSDVDIISSLCDLMARGAIVSMFAVILFLPAMFMLFDKMICVTSIGFRNKNAEPSNTLKERTA